MYSLLRWTLAASLAPALLIAQKKPVTLDAISRGGPPAAGTSVNWAPDGKRFVYRQGARLMLYDAGARTEKLLLTTAALESASTKVPPSDTFGWENRRVREESIQWAPDGKNLIAVSGGDVFLIKVDAGGWIQLTATPIAERDPKLSPDGRLLAYRHNHDLYVMNLES